MTISITEFKAKCLHLIRQVEAQGKPIDIVRRGRVVARLASAAPAGAPCDKPWQRLRGSGRLESTPGESALADSDSKRCVERPAAMSLWEAQMLNAKGRLKLDLPFDRWLREAASLEVVHILPLDIEVVLGLGTLPPRFHGDPADRIIVATARVFNLPLLSFDAAIRKARVVRLWKVP